MPWSPKRARGRARRGSVDGRATPAPSTRRRPAMGEACEHSKSWDRVWNDPSRRQARWCQPVLDDGGIDLQTFQVAVTAEDPGAALEAQDQAGVVTDRVLGVGDAALRQRSFARAPGTGQQAQLAHRPPADPGQRIELRNPRGSRRTWRCRRARRGAPEAGLEHRNSLLKPIWHLNTPQRRDD